MKLGIIGNGFVGQAGCQLKCKDIKLIAYDTRPEACIPEGTTMADILLTDLVMSQFTKISFHISMNLFLQYK